ncbi:beta-1,4-N-acetylgalactosaminyltransferase bre-4 [Nilaparvata lugens]|uniref:beta-1,4-N-acetylgalactosaminyltransferase bre-4 n=1 Tax=Nilaparvata lugens TaxID=108931 RepID=UPI00193DDBDF|nr:beta-1,4-N-acetylgalactosaminyltransferase bre-4 [Nilaparvata lugens]
MSSFLHFGRGKCSYTCNKKLLFLILLVAVIVVNILLYAFGFLTHSAAKIITLAELPNFLVPAPHNLKEVRDDELCDLMPKFVNTVLPYPNVNVTENDLKQLDKLDISEGGAWKPHDCVSQHHVAIVVPYRDRIQNLHVFLYHMHPFLQAQKLNYQIFIVEQTHQRPFNRAKLFNVGFSEAGKISPFHCFIFTDVDLIPQNLNNMYACTELPRHMTAYIDVFDYQLPYGSLFGGAVAILKSYFERVNGFSNTFYGWGGEDDDFFNRVTRNGSRICRYEYKISKYVMLSHKKQKPSEDRYHLLETGVDRFLTDGLNSLKYSVLSLDKLPLYTRILTDL